MAKSDTVASLEMELSRQRARLGDAKAELRRSNEVARRAKSKKAEAEDAIDSIKGTISVLDPDWVDPASDAEDGEG